MRGEMGDPQNPGRPGTEDFVPGHLLLPSSRDKGTTGRPFPWKP